MVRIKDANPLPGYRLHLRFTDGAEGTVDLSHLVGKGVFAAWCDPAKFAAVTVDPLTRTVAWPDGIDLDAGVLYERATGRRAPGRDAAA